MHSVVTYKGSQVRSSSGETAAGSFPVAAVRIMQSICEESENNIDSMRIYKEVIRTTMNTQEWGTMSAIEAVASSAAVITTTVREKEKFHVFLCILSIHFRSAGACYRNHSRNALNVRRAG